ncbi:hypothetical protein [Pantoea ananatis]|uniref:hypothetical protein n=1 Tax=Pantoea ananas TaxID=553 RepID=UPI0023AF5A2F|nr:hypothetical protein [Pantoea ananatis]
MYIDFITPALPITARFFHIPRRALLARTLLPSRDYLCLHQEVARYVQQKRDARQTRQQIETLLTRVSG